MTLMGRVENHVGISPHQQSGVNVISSFYFLNKKKNVDNPTTIETIILLTKDHCSKNTQRSVCPAVQFASGGHEGLPLPATWHDRFLRNVRIVFCAELLRDILGSLLCFRRTFRKSGVKEHEGSVKTERVLRRGRIHGSIDPSSLP